MVGQLGQHGGHYDTYGVVEESFIYFPNTGLWLLLEKNI